MISTIYTIEEAAEILGISYASMKMISKRSSIKHATV